MTLLSRVPALRWLAPFAVVAVLLGGTAAVRGISTAAARSTDLPARTAAQLLADVSQARVDGMSGTIVQTADLGIPALPTTGLGGSTSSELSSMISGTHTLRVWYAGESMIRLSLLGTLGESDIIRNGSDIWTWSSSANTATHRVLPAGAKGAAPQATDLPATPQQLAEQAVKAIEPSTTVTVSSNAVVAGRPAYELVLTPKDSRSLVAGVRIAVDGTQHIPTRVQVMATGKADPAFEVAFTAIDFGQPDAAQFRFNPPPGVKVTESGKLGFPGSPTAGLNELNGTGIPDMPTTRGIQGLTTEFSDQGPMGMKAGMGTKVVGSGWTRVVVTRLPLMALMGGYGNSSTGNTGATLAKVVGALPTISGSWGSGRVLAGTLFSVILADDGRIAVGAVAPDLLGTALAGK